MKSKLTVLLIFLFTLGYSNDKKASISGSIKSKETKVAIPFVNISLLTEQLEFVQGTISDEDGFFVLRDVPQGRFMVKISAIGYEEQQQELTISAISDSYNIGSILLTSSSITLEEVSVQLQRAELDEKMNKKTYNMSEMTSQTGGSLLESLKGLPGITTTQEGQVELRGSSNVAILLDGQQSALTGFGSQSGLDNIPASAIERIEIINNPSAKYDANGQAGVINVILKKEKKKGFNGQVGLTGGLGSLWEKKSNMPGIDPQYKMTPKYNPSLSLNYRGEKTNLFFQGDYLWFKRVNKNEFYERTYSDNTIVRQQYLENRTQNIPTIQTGIDWFIDDNNQLTFAGNYSRKSYLDKGSLPFFNEDFSERQRLWLFTEKELVTSTGLTSTYKHFFKEPGHHLDVHTSYTFIAKDEYYEMDDTTPLGSSSDRFDLLADQHITDFNIDYGKPLKHGRLEVGSKFRWRKLPLSIIYYPGPTSIIDLNAGGQATYNEVIPALYGNYLYEHKNLEAEVGLRAEYVSVDYTIKQVENIYPDDGYEYLKLFPNLRLGYNFDDNNKVSLFYNKRVDRPDEKELRAFPKYDDPEILKIGNPALKPQYTQSVELGYRTSWSNNYLYTAVYYRGITDYISTIFTSSTSGAIYSIPQNTADAINTGVEMVYNQQVTPWFKFNANLNGYLNQMSAFTVENVYPDKVWYSSGQKKNYTGNIKLNTNFNVSKDIELQLFGTYKAKDIIPQGEIGASYTVDFGLKKSIQNNKGEVFINATDLFNSMDVVQRIDGDLVTIRSRDYIESQVFRLGYVYKF